MNYHYCEKIFQPIDLQSTLDLEHLELAYLKITFFSKIQNRHINIS